MLYDLIFIAPILVAAIAIVLAILLRVDKVGIGLIGGLAAVVAGAAGTFILGQVLMDALMYVSHFSHEMFVESWRRMWYPLATGVAIAIGLAVYALIARNSDKREWHRSERRIRTERTTEHPT